MLTGCASIMPDYNDQSYSEAPNQPFAQALKDEQWVRDEYAEYRSRRGHKAFAVAISHQTVIATGFGDDKITMQWAEQEALRMCHHYSAGDGTCVIVDKDSKQGRHGLSQAQIDAAPKELIAHRDIIRYQDYSAANAPKAFVVAACSGQSFWLAEQDTVSKPQKTPYWPVKMAAMPLILAVCCWKASSSNLYMLTFGNFPIII
ncbi:MAG: hypothetical protein QF872_05565 [Gammaproteobacteria bacterium]|nr:hypothetical protein [Gammaproteobacteria bacterium]